jgi:DNA invertase Pin-like site-specific DNA recombinase
MVDRIKLVGVDEKGYRIGESHPRAKLTDAQVDQIRNLFEEGFVGYRALARFFGVPRTTIASICRYERRACTVMDVKPVRVEE